MLAIGGLTTILLVLAGILSRKLSPLVALAGIPPLAAVLLGFGRETGQLMFDGIVQVAPMAAMFLFAILFFGILSDAGLFDPLVRFIVRASNDHPPHVAVGTAILTSIVHLDGAGATTFLIVIPALLPVYDRIGMSRLTLTVIVAMAAGVGNMLPWGGPTIRAATALNVPVMELFGPMVPVYAVGVVAVLALSWWIGRKAMPNAQSASVAFVADVSIHRKEAEGQMSGVRLALNWLLVLTVIGAMLVELLPPAVAFLLGTVVALLCNRRAVDDQNKAIAEHAANSIGMVAILCAAGSFTGILRGTGMIDALAGSGAALLPQGAGGSLALITAVLSMPLSLLFDPDSFYFGVLPVLASVAEAGGGSAIDVGRAAIVGQMTTGFPISPLTPATFLLVGLAQVNLADHQRAAIGYLFLLSLIMTGACLLFGIFTPW